MDYKTFDNPCGPWHHIPHFYKAWFKQPRQKHEHLKHHILTALKEKPLSGYEIIKAIEKKFSHTPSAAVIYPTLQLLEDQGYVDSKEHENKKIYALTDEGKKCLEENRERIDQLAVSLGPSKWNSLPGIGTRIASLAGTIFSNCNSLDDAKIKRIEELLDETRKRVSDIIFENQAG